MRLCFPSYFPAYSPHLCVFQLVLSFSVTTRICSLIKACQLREETGTFIRRLDQPTRLTTSMSCSLIQLTGNGNMSVFSRQPPPEGQPDPQKRQPTRPPSRSRRTFLGRFVSLG